MSLKATILDDVKQSMRTGNKARLRILRMLTAALKQKEVDERIEVDDTDVIAIIEKMIKQRKDSTDQFQQAGRAELAAGEIAEIEVLAEFMPQALDDDEISTLIDAAFKESGANTMQDMGQVMAILKPQLQGRADMGAVSKKVRAQLGT